MTSNVGVGAAIVLLWHSLIGEAVWACENPEAMIICVLGLMIRDTLRMKRLFATFEMKHQGAFAEKLTMGAKVPCEWVVILGGEVMQGGMGWLC